MKLLELEPQFIRYEEKLEIGKFVKPGIDPARGNWTDDDFEEREHLAQYLVHVDSIAEADAIMFRCPVCFAKNGGARGTHQILCNRPRVPLRPDRVGPGRWEFSGTGYGDLTLTAGSSSILLLGPGCAAHFFIQNGEIR